MTFVVGKLRASQLNDLLNENSPFALGLVARGRRETNSSTTTTEVGVLRLDDTPILGGRTYEIGTSTLLSDSSVANDVIAAKVRYTTDGSTPTTSSTQMAISQMLQANATFQVDTKILVTYTPASDETLSLLLTVARSTGGGSVSLVGGATNPIELKVNDVGPDKGDTGVDI